MICKVLEWVLPVNSINLWILITSLIFIIALASCTSKKSYHLEESNWIRIYEIKGSLDSLQLTTVNCTANGQSTFPIINLNKLS